MAEGAVAKKPGVLSTFNPLSGSATAKVVKTTLALSLVGLTSGAMGGDLLLESAGDITTFLPETGDPNFLETAGNFTWNAGAHAVNGVGTTWNSISALGGAGFDMATGADWDAAYDALNLN